MIWICQCHRRFWSLSLSLIFVATWTILGSALLPSLNSSIVSRSSWHWKHYYTKTHPDCFSIIFPVHFLIIVLCNKRKSCRIISHHLLRSSSSFSLFCSDAQLHNCSHIVFVHLLKDFCHSSLWTCIVTIRWDLTLKRLHNNDANLLHTWKYSWRLYIESEH